MYAYAYGQLLALSVYARYEAAGRRLRAAVPRPARARAARCSPEELGAIVGVDLADPGFWDGGLDIIEEQLEAAEAAARDSGRL